MSKQYRRKDVFERDEDEGSGRPSRDQKKHRKYKHTMFEVDEDDDYEDDDEAFDDEDE